MKRKISKKQLMTTFLMIVGNVALMAEGISIVGLYDMKKPEKFFKQ